MTILYALNDGLKGDRVACQAAKIVEKPLAHIGGHRIQKVVCYEKVYCIIEKPTMLKS
jgi:hypothetical protein